METFYKKEFDTVFWRDSIGLPWKSAELESLIDSYSDQPYTNLTYWTTVKSEETGKELYHLFMCDECDSVVPSIDKEPDIEFCPYCGKIILNKYF